MILTLRASRIFFLARFLPWKNMHNIKARLWCTYMYARTCVGVYMCICFGVLILLCIIQRKKKQPPVICNIACQTKNDVLKHMAN